MAEQSSAPQSAVTLPTINWREVPKQALIDALRNTSLGPTNLSAQDKADLVAIARGALRTDKAMALRAALSREVSFRLGRDYDYTSG